MTTLKKKAEARARRFKAAHKRTPLHLPPSWLDHIDAQDDLERYGGRL